MNTKKRQFTDGKDEDVVEADDDTDDVDWYSAECIKACLITLILHEALWRDICMIKKLSVSA